MPVCSLHFYSDQSPSPHSAQTSANIIGIYEHRCLLWHVLLCVQKITCPHLDACITDSVNVSLEKHNKVWHLKQQSTMYYSNIELNIESTRFKQNLSQLLVDYTINSQSQYLSPKKVFTSRTHHNLWNSAHTGLVIFNCSESITQNNLLIPSRRFW